MVTVSSKKIRCIDDDGKEVYEDDDPYAFLRFREAGQLRPAKKVKLQPTAAAEDVEGDNEEEEDKPDPELAISKLEAASAELTVAIDLIENVSTLRAVMVQYADARRYDSKKKVDVIRNKANMVKDKALLVETKHRQLKQAAERFRSAAQLLRKSVQRENTFVTELSALQSFWRLRRPRTEGAPFVIDLSFPLSKSAAGQNRAAGSARNPPPLPCETLTIIQGFDGNVVIGVEPDEQAVPSVQGAGEHSAAVNTTPRTVMAVGVKEVHALLQRRLSRLFWTAVEQRVSWETNRHMHALFTQPLIQKTLALMAQPQSSSHVRLFRPIVMSLMASRLAPEPSPFQRLGGRAAGPLEQLASSLLMYWQHQYFVILLLRSIDKQVRAYPGTIVTLLLTGRPHTTALLVDGRHRGTLIICCRHMGYSVQAMPHGWSPLNNSRWLSEHLLKHLTQQELSTVLERYWGPDDRSGS